MGDGPSHPQPTPRPPTRTRRLPAGREQLLASFSNGALLIDKPLGWTSFDVCGKLRNTLKFLGVKKVLAPCVCVGGGGRLVTPDS